MDRIYTGTYCNISATAASNGSVGLFFDHDTGISQPLKVRVGSAHYRVIDSEFWRRNIEEAPLNRRAWVCQERMLSPRNLHFASTQMFWECRELSGCETFPMGFPPSVHRTTMTKRITSQDGSGLRLGLEFPVDPRLEAYSKWASIVQTYSKGSLTKETDKLVAIAGIAAQVQHLVDDRYLGGMWQRHLASSLTWEVNKDIPSMRPLSYVAPSWSWASVNGEITGLGDISYADGRDVLVDIVAAEVEYETSNIFGQVKGGSLCLQGNLARMAVNSADIFPTVFTEAPQPLNIVVKPDITYSNNERIEWHHEYLFALLTKDGRGRLPIGRIEGLLLETTGNAGQFLRWGKFSAGFDKIGVLYEACKFFDSKASESGLKYCDDGKGGYKYTITIV